VDEQLLSVGESDNYETDGNKWLEVRYSDGEIEISAPNLSPVRLSSGEVYDVSGVAKLTVRNASGAANKVTLQTFDRLKVGNLATDVSVSNAVIVERINQPLDFEANVVFEEGTVHVISGAQVADKDDINISSKQSKKLVDANPNRKAVLIQILSDAKTALRIGSSNVSAIRGIYAAGSKLAPAIVPIETSAELHAFNDTDGVAAVVSITEVLK